MSGMDQNPEPFNVVHLPKGVTQDDIEQFSAFWIQSNQDQAAAQDYWADQ